MMTASEILDRFEELESKHRRSLLKTSSNLKGLSREYFDRVVSYLGSRPDRALSLTKDWRLFEAYCEYPEYAWRAKAVGERIKGKWRLSADSFTKSASLAASDIDRLSFQVGAIDSLARAGQTDRAVRLGKHLAEKLVAIGEGVLAGRALLNTGNALLWNDRHRAARAVFQKALNRLEGTDYRYEAAACRLGLSTCSLFLESAKVALQKAEEAERIFDELGATAYAIQAKVNQAHCHIRMGRADEGVRLLLDARVKVPNESPDFGRICQFLGDAYLDLSLLSAAKDAYSAGITSLGLVELPLNRANCHLGLGEALLKEGNVPAAKVSLRRANAGYTKHGNLVFAGLAEAQLGKAEIALGKTKGGRTRISKAADQFRKGSLGYFLVDCLLTLAETAKDREKQLSLVSEAESWVRRRGMIGHAWRVHAIRGSLGNPVEAIRHYRKMIQAIIEHQASLSTITARATLLEGKQDAIRSYLRLLLDSYTSTNAKEIRRVIYELRASTLLDEILAAPQTVQSQEALDALRSLRAELEESGSEDLGNGPVRRLAGYAKVKSSSFRQYLEQQEFKIARSQRIKNDTVSGNVFAFIEGGSVWLTPTHEVRLSVTDSALSDMLKWLHFELEAPLHGFFGDPEAVFEQARQVADTLRVEELPIHHDILIVSPESAAYEVPWTLVKPDVEPLIVLKPGRVSNPSEILFESDAKVAIWYHTRSELPHIDHEVQNLLSLYPSAMVCRTVAEVIACCSDGRFDLVHIAAHGTFNTDNPMFSSIQLEDGRLMACDVARSSLRTRVAVLSSCDSAVMGRSAWEPQGLTRAFLACGAEIVLSSLWRLDDKAAAQTFEVFYRTMKGGKSLLNALQEARSEVRALYPHPAFWAPLVMFGGYQ